MCIWLHKVSLRLKVFTLVVKHQTKMFEISMSQGRQTSFVNKGGDLYFLILKVTEKSLTF